jgi:hypothetical protein
MAAWQSAVAQAETSMPNVIAGEDDPRRSAENPRAGYPWVPANPPLFARSTFRVMYLAHEGARAALRGHQPPGRLAPAAYAATLITRRPVRPVRAS